MTNSTFASIRNLALSAAIVAVTGVAAAQPVEITSLPWAIEDPGSYILVDNLSGPRGITIAADHVTLDLRGFALTGTPGSGSGVKVRGGHFDITIKDGTISTWGEYGILADRAFGAMFEGLRVSGSGLSGLVAGEGSVVKDVTSTLNGLDGIATGMDSLVVDSVANANGESGIAAGLHSQIFDCVASENQEFGMKSADGGTVRNCTASRNKKGVDIGNGCFVEQNVLCENTEAGIVGQARNVIRANDVHLTTGVGITTFFSGNRIEDNNMTDNAIGIQVFGAQSLIICNSFSGNITDDLIGIGNSVGFMRDVTADGAFSSDPMDNLVF